MIAVAIALVWRDGKLLIARRPSGVHLAGLWEFPGGKIEAGESAEACAEREVREETGLCVRARARRAPIVHDYGERQVELHPVDCDWIGGEPEARQVEALSWVLAAELPSYELPPANAPLVRELARASLENPR